ncbi:Integrase core domain protein (fragment) [Candidatus Zixiibacteriota bacterium]
MRILTDHGTENCGNRDYHEYQLWRTIERINHGKIKACHPQSNDICEKFHKTILNKFNQAAFRK